MKNKKPVLHILIGAAVGFIAFVLISLLFQKLNLFDFSNRSLGSIIIEGLVVSFGIFLVMILYSRKRFKKTTQQ